MTNSNLTKYVWFTFTHKHYKTKKIVQNVEVTDKMTKTEEEEEAAAEKETEGK